MKIEVEKLAKAMVEIKCEMAWEEFKPYCARAFEALSKDVVLKGFRPGKAPKDLLEKEISRDKVLAQAVDEAVREKYLEIIAKEPFEPIGPPQVEVLKLAENNPFCFKLVVDVLPEVKLSDYKKIASGVAIVKTSLDNKEVEDALGFLRKSRAKFEDLARPAQKGDFVEIEYKSPQIKENKTFEDGFLLGEGHLVQGFEEELEGMKKEEEKKFETVFPADYFQKELAGKKAEFAVKMKKVQRMELPELNDDFAKNLGDFKTLQDLKNNIEEGMRKEKEMQEIRKWREEILEKIGEDTIFEIPECLVTEERERMWQDLKSSVEKELKIDFRDYLKQIKKEEAGLKGEFSLSAQKRVKNFLILREIGKKEKIEVSDKEIEQATNNLLTSYPQLNPQEIDKENLRGIIYNEKVFKKLESFI